MTRDMASIRLLSLIAAMAAFFAVAHFTGAGALLDQNYVQGHLARMGYWAPLAFLSVYIVVTAFGVPTSPFIVTGGVIFGGTAGALLSTLGSTFGACGSYFMARYLAHDYIMARFGHRPWFKKLEEGVIRGGMLFIMFVRIMPVIPFNGTNFACGLTRISLRDYFFGTMLGVIPACFILSNSSYQLARAASGQVDYSLVLWLAALAALASSPFAYKMLRPKGVELSGEGEEA